MSDEWTLCILDFSMNQKDGSPTFHSFSRSIIDLIYSYRKSPAFVCGDLLLPSHMIWRVALFSSTKLTAWEHNDDDGVSFLLDNWVRQWDPVFQKTVPLYSATSKPAEFSIHPAFSHHPSAWLGYFLCLASRSKSITDHFCPCSPFRASSRFC